MKLLEKIESDFTKAMKSGDSLRSQTLKMIKSDLSYEKGKTGKELTEELVLEVVSRAAKRRKESIREFQKGNREDLARQESDELKIIEEYLPEQISEEAIGRIIAEKVSAMGEVTQKDFGRVMGELMKELKGQADGALVKRILAEKLEKK